MYVLIIENSLIQATVEYLKAFIRLFYEMALATNNPENKE